MATRHFLKTLLLFTGMIILGLIGVFLVNYFHQKEGVSTKQVNTAKVAK